MREGDASQGPLENKLQDRLIGVDFLNLACEGLLLRMQAEGPTCRRPPSAITLAELAGLKEMQAEGPPGDVSI
jgi:hypothetical protein